MGKFAIFVVLAAYGIAACASESSPSTGEWDADPLSWACCEGKIECRSPGGFAVNGKAVRSSAVKVAAALTPISAETKDWATLGVALYDDDRNYWHLAFVQAPPGRKSARFFELCESRNGSWLAQNEDKLKVERSVEAGSWQYGKTYSFVLSADAKGIEGEVRDETGAVVFARRFAFPNPRADGSVAAVTCGRAALHANGGFCGAFSAVDMHHGNPCPRKVVPSAVPPYRSDSFVSEVKEPATGFFRVVRRRDGRWWAIDPLGRGMVPMGVDHVRYKGHWSQRTGRSVHYEANKRKFPSKDDWEADTLRRLKSWGFNMLGAGCDEALRRRGLVHTVFLGMGDSMCRDLGDDALWICPNEGRPCSAFPNVFDPLFPEHCDYVARRNCAPARDDPWLFGYFIDNELAWWGRGGRGTGLFDAVMAKSEKHSAKKALRAFLAERGVTGEPSEGDKIAFLRLAADRYFRFASAAIRRHDPNHLVLGARFAGLGGAHDTVWEVAGKYCDLVTFNIYPWADIERNVVFVDRGKKSRRVVDAFAERHSIAKRPMLITEWSFPALDSGLPCTAGAGQRFRTQRERTEATELFAKTMLATPSILGYDYFMWVDEPAEGISDAFPEDSNYGLVDLNGDAYPEITSMFADIQRNAGRWRRSSPPAERESAPSRLDTAEAFCAKLPSPSKPGGVTFSRNGDAYAVSTRAGFALAGRVGGGMVFSDVALKGVALGQYNTMVNYMSGGPRWQDMARISDVSFSEKGGWGVLRVAGTWSSHDGRFGFELTQSIRVHPDLPYMVCEVEKVVNTGRDPLDIRAIFMRQYAEYAADGSGADRRTVPNLWKAPLCDAWVRSADGAWWGGLTTSSACSAFKYFVTGEGRIQHPDVRFELLGEAPAGSPDGCWRLAPGASFDPRGTIWALCAGGDGGYEGFDRAVSTLTR